MKSWLELSFMFTLMAKNRYNDSNNHGTEQDMHGQQILNPTQFVEVGYFQNDLLKL